jgi:predicted  nucleic acid-binding Zn-ribbon protein
MFNAALTTTGGVMFSMGPLFSESGDAVFGLVAFFILNVIINLFLINKIFEERRQHRRLARHKVDPRDIIKEFLDEQQSRTRSHNRSLLDEVKLEKAVIYLRVAYMKIESNALMYEINTPSYWQYLNEQLPKLIKAAAPHLLHKDNEIKELQSKIGLLKEKISHIPTQSDSISVAEKKAKVVELLDNIAQQHVHGGGDRARLRKQVQKIEHLVHLFEDPRLRKQYSLNKRNNAYLKNSQRHLNSLHDNYVINEANIHSMEKNLAGAKNVDALAHELSHFKDENSKLNLHVEQLKQELKSFQNRIGNPDTPTLFIEMQKDKKSADRDMYDLSDEILQANEREIDRLRDVISNQRKSMMDMEESLQNLEQLTESESSVHRIEVEKLKQCIQESEICISMLEKELDDLKSDLYVMRTHREEQSITLTETDQLDSELSSIKTELERAMDRSQRSDALLEFVKEALRAESMEDISLLVYENITSLNYLPSVIIKGLDRTLELGPQNTVSMRDKVLLNNMQINEINPGIKGQLSFRFLNIAGFIRPPEGEELHSDDQTHIVEMMRIADRLLTHLANNQKIRSSAKAHDNTVNIIKQISFEMDKMLDEYAKKTKRLVSTNFGQLQSMARAKGLGATHIASFNAVEQETLRQLEAENTLRLKLRKQFLALLNHMEN